MYIQGVSHEWTAMLFVTGCCKWWKNVAKRFATLEFGHTRKSIGAVVKASSSACIRGRELLKLYLSIGACSGCRCMGISLGGGGGMCCMCRRQPGTQVLHIGPGQDERDGHEATKASCEYVGLCFQQLHPLGC